MENNDPFTEYEAQLDNLLKDKCISPLMYLEFKHNLEKQRQNGLSIKPLKTTRTVWSFKDYFLYPLRALRNYVSQKRFRMQIRQENKEALRNISNTKDGK